MSLYNIAVFTVLILVFMPSFIANIVALGNVQFVKAGKVDDFCIRYALLPHARIKEIRVGNTIRNVSDLLMFLVHGNSMRQFGVCSGQRIFVRHLSDDMLNGIDTHPVLMFHIIGAKKWESQYKLRKFIGYVNAGTTDWGAVFDAYTDEITALSRNEFIEAMQRKVQKIDINSERHILSVTFNEHSKSLEYSLHPVSSLFGIVKYAA